MDNQIKLPSAFQVNEKVGLQMLIDMLERARDGETTRVSFMNGKVKYDLQIPIREGNRLDDSAPIVGYFRIANVDSAFVHEPYANGFHYNSLRDRNIREHQQIVNEAQSTVFDDRTDRQRWADEFINDTDPNIPQGSQIISHLKRLRDNPPQD